MQTSHGLTLKKHTTACHHDGPHLHKVMFIVLRPAGIIKIPINQSTYTVVSSMKAHGL